METSRFIIPKELLVLQCGSGSESRGWRRKRGTEHPGGRRKRRRREEGRANVNQVRTEKNINQFQGSRKQTPVKVKP